VFFRRHGKTLPARDTHCMGKGNEQLRWWGRCHFDSHFL